MIVLDWSAAEHWSPRRGRCLHCGRLTNLRNAAGRPAHKACVERAVAEQARPADEARTA